MFVELHLKYPNRQNVKSRLVGIFSFFIVSKITLTKDKSCGWSLGKKKDFSNIVFSTSEFTVLYNDFDVVSLLSFHFQVPLLPIQLEIKFDFYLVYHNVMLLAK